MPLPALVRQSTGGLSFSLTGAAAGGNTLVASITCYGSPPPTITGITTTNVTWTLITAGGAGTVRTELWLGSVSGTSGTSVTVSKSGASTDVVCNIAEYSDVATTSPIDATGVSNTGTSTTATTASYTSVTANCLVVTCVGYDNANFMGSASGYNALTSVALASGVVAPYYKTGVAAGSQSASWSQSPSGNWATSLVALKPTAIVNGFARTLGVGKVSSITSTLFHVNGKTNGVAEVLGRGGSILHIASSSFGTQTTKAVFTKYWGAGRTFGVATVKATNHTIFHTASLSRGTSQVTVTITGKLSNRGRTVGVGFTRGPIRKITLPAPSSSGMRVGQWTAFRPAN